MKLPAVSIPIDDPTLAFILGAIEQAPDWTLEAALRHPESVWVRRHYDDTFEVGFTEVDDEPPGRYGSHEAWAEAKKLWEASGTDSPVHHIAAALRATYLKGYLAGRKDPSGRPAPADVMTELHKLEDAVAALCAAFATESKE